MDAKEYLSQARFLDARITCMTQQVARLNELAGRCTSTFSDMPKSVSTGKSRLEDCVIKIIDLEDSINNDIDRLVDLRKEIMTVIRAVPDMEYQILLEKRYLCFASWKQIATDMEYSIQHIHRMHGNALKQVVVPDESKKIDVKINHYDVYIIPKNVETKCD